MSDSCPAEVETPGFTIIQSGDGLEYLVAMDRPGDCRAIIPFFGDRQDAQRWIDGAGEQWRRLAFPQTEWARAA
jgi:hypothetical protein